MIFAGFDIGTGSLKLSALVDGELRVVAAYPFPVHSPEPGVATQDPKLALNLVKKGISELFKTFPREEITLAFSSAMHAVACFSPETGEISDAMIWSDQRAAQYSKALRATPLAQEFYRATGTPVHAMSPLCKIRWIRENTSWLNSSNSRIMGIKDYIWWKLTGELVTDFSLASATGLMHLGNKQWHLPALKWAGINENQLPVIASPGHKFHLSLPEGTITLVLGAADGCLANYGTQSLEAGQAALTLGTSGALRVGMNQPTFVFPEMLFNYRLNETTIITGAAINNAGLALNWACELLNLSHDELLELAQDGEPGATGLCFLPYLSGERAPWWDPELTASFSGIQVTHKRMHFARAVVEGILLPFIPIIRVMESNHIPVNTITACGGLLKSEFLAQLLADITGKPVNRFAEIDASSLGAIRLAASETGANPEFRLTENWFQPDKNIHQLYQEVVFPQAMQIHSKLYK